MSRIAVRADSGSMRRAASGSFMLRRTSSVIASMLRRTLSWSPVMAATRAAAMWPAALRGSTGWPARWGAAAGAATLLSGGGGSAVQAAARRQAARVAGLRVVMRPSPGVWVVAVCWRARGWSDPADDAGVAASAAPTGGLRVFSVATHGVLAVVVVQRAQR